ncbi:GPI-linked NAD(P)(+)--arginine ADP-ribosyltransferase 1 [Danio aesculapii]|uniref:GPI-linked NAD(P)(+)--arginine ADP-ribosyltransferase 1 n=1 Tax=Danio aesculapii TaxID=1142201 RepID=UPI0024C07C6C|nr:GPI-linked NAD(P)(+)--arginine ADP-ribosyltransferase 1 [Danio aesculapii]
MMRVLSLALLLIYCLLPLCLTEEADLKSSKGFDWIKMLPIIKYLLILAALGQDHTTAEGKNLDMALKSVDDQYEGCINDMAHMVTTVYMKKETSDPKSNFTKAWEDGVRNAKKPTDANLKMNHSIAIHVYTGDRVYSTFNKAVGSDKNRYKDKKYNWYSLHFWLTEAVQILRKNQGGCKTSYRGTKDTYSTKNVVGKEVRFGSFASSSFKQAEANRFGDKSCFEIYTCQGAHVEKYSVYPHEKEVLIPPYETFNVTAVRTKKDDPKLWCDSVFTLRSLRTISYVNCAAASSSGKPVAFFSVVSISALFCYVFKY